MYWPDGPSRTAARTVTVGLMSHWVRTMQQTPRYILTSPLSYAAPNLHSTNGTANFTPFR